jgi:hypothetical protein
MVLFLIGIPLYAFLKARRERLGQVPEPTEMSDDQVAAALIEAR